MESSLFSCAFLDNFDDTGRTTDQLAATDDEYRRFGSSVKRGSKLLGMISRRGITDKVLIAIALLFFVACVAYVVYERSLKWII